VPVASRTLWIAVAATCGLAGWCSGALLIPEAPQDGVFVAVDFAARPEPVDPIGGPPRTAVVAGGERTAPDPGGVEAPTGGVIVSQVTNLPPPTALPGPHGARIRTGEAVDDALLRAEVLLSGPLTERPSVADQQAELRRRAIIEIVPKVIRQRVRLGPGPWESAEFQMIAAVGGPGRPATFGREAVPFASPETSARWWTAQGDGTTHDAEHILSELRTHEERRKRLLSQLLSAAVAASHRTEPSLSPGLVVRDGALLMVPPGAKSVTEGALTYDSTLRALWSAVDEFVTEHQ
jgi:hypothetical protein